MGENLVIVESPAKAKTIEKFLGKDFTVKSSFGHIRDLAKKNLGIDINNGFEPQYEISSDKKKVVADLKKLAKEATTIWIASDEDREGEAIAWHLFHTLDLKSENTKRIAFHEITKSAILSAIKNPRQIDENLVMAQQARRVLDRLVGFELSPILWKKVQPKLSAGRVQSVAVRLIVDREREIAGFNSEPYFKIDAYFLVEGGKRALKATLDKKFATEQEALAFLQRCKDAYFTISNIEKRSATRTPAAPFTTSVLQQEASRKLGLSVSQTMRVAQELYEAGLITYMRTDSVNLSALAINGAKEYIINNYSEEYSHVRQYRTKSKGAQEAHEAIRPTFMSNFEIEGTPVQKRLYNLIWKRTVASQMEDAKLEKTKVSVTSDNIDEIFFIEAEKVLFDGFLKLYIEGKDEEGDDETLTFLPNLSVGQKMIAKSITSTQKYTQHPPRYTEASLVKKLEELGIGRPSTYAPTITTIMNRGYVVKGELDGQQRSCTIHILENGEISTKTTTEIIGKDNGKLRPENIGMLVTDYLSEHFPTILDYGFTAKVEEDFDEIAEGKAIWNSVIAEFYAPFHNKVEETLAEKEYTRNERELGTDPTTGKIVSVRMAKYGAVVQIGASDDPDKRYAGMKSGQLLETITLEEALKLFELPRTLGEYQGFEVIVAKGRFGPYVRLDKEFFSLAKGQDPMEITLDDAIKLIEDKRLKDSQKVIATFPDSDIEILNGRYGPYFKQGSQNYKLPKEIDAYNLTEKECLDMIASGEAIATGGAKKRTTTKKK